MQVRGGGKGLGPSNDLSAGLLDGDNLSSFLGGGGVRCNVVVLECSVFQW